MAINNPKSVDYKFSEASSGLSGIARTLVIFFLGVIVTSAMTLVFYRREQVSGSDSNVRRTESELRIEQERTQTLTKQLNDARSALQAEREARASTDSRLAELEKRLAVAPARSAMTIPDLQANLVRLGFYNGKADGVMGQRTLKALKAFQQASKLPVTGLLDAATVEALAR